MKIFIRVDSGYAIGTGHVMRCLTLADALGHFFKDKDPKIVFLSRPHTGNIIEFIQKKGYEVISLSCPEFSGGSDEKSWLGTLQEKDALECLPIVNEADLLIIDHYSIDSIWENIVRSYVQKIFVIDDLANRHHNCDILLDQNFYLDKDIRYQGLIPENCQIFTGPEYALLRPEFFEMAKDYHFSKEVKNILVFFGGVDSTGMTLKTINILKDYDYISHIICGTSNNDKNEIKELCASYDNLIFYDNVENMAKMMASCDVAIGAGGTTQWERACIGIPSLVFSIADNQTKICEDMAKMSYILYGGEVKNIQLSSLKIIIQFFIENHFLREALFINNKKLIQNDRLNIINKLFYSSLTLRRATLEDCDNVYHWRNAPETRKFSNNNDIIPYNNHVGWYKKAIQDENKFLLIALENEKAVGFLRYDFLAETIMTSIYLVPGHNGRGLGISILKAGEEYLKTENKTSVPIVAEILNDNKASEKLFIKMGFQKYKSIYQKYL